MNYKKIFLTAILVSSMPIACNVIDIGADILENDRRQNGDGYQNRYVYVSQDERSPAEKLSEIFSMVENGSFLVPVLGKDNRGDNDFRDTYSQFGISRTIDPEYRVEQNAAIGEKCKAESYIPKGALSSTPSDDAKDCADALKPAVANLIVSMESYVEPHVGFTNALKNFMGAKYALLEIAGKPMFVDPDSSEAPKAQIKKMLDAAMADVPYAHVAMYPTVHFDAGSKQPACLSQTLIFSRLTDAPKFSWGDDTLQEEDEIEVNEKAYGVNGLNLRFYGDTKVVQAMRSFYRQEYVAALFSSDFDAYSVLQYMPIYKDQSLDIEAYFDDDFSLGCDGAAGSDSSEASCMLLRGRDIATADKCPLVSVRINR